MSLWTSPAWQRQPLLSYGKAFRARLPALDAIDRPFKAKGDLLKGAWSRETLSKQCRKGSESHPFSIEGSR